MRAWKAQVLIAVTGTLLLAGSMVPGFASGRELPEGFLNGTYAVVGQRPDTGETYRGKLDLQEAGGKVQALRSIGGAKIRATGSIEKAAGGDVEVLRVRFTKDGKRYEATYLIDADLDNYARLSGYVYLKDGGTRRVGLEALFADHGQLER